MKIKKILVTGLIVAIALTGCVSSHNDEKDSAIPSSADALKLNGVWNCFATDVDNESMLIKTTKQYDFDANTGKYLSSGFVSISFKKISDKTVNINLIRFQKGSWQVKGNTIVDTSYYSRADYFPQKSKEFIEDSKFLSGIFDPFRKILTHTNKQSQVLIIDNLSFDELSMYLNEKTEEQSITCKKVKSDKDILPQFKEPYRSKIFGKN